MPESDEAKAQVNAKIRATVKRRLDHAVIDEGRQLRDIVDEAVEEWLIRHNY